MKHKIVWLTGQSGAGKTTVAKLVQKFLGKTIILDGDEMRESISLGAGFSREDRREHNYRVARLAKILSKQANILVSVIAPMRDVREGITGICNPLWVYVKRTLPERNGHFYEEPDDKCLMVDHDVLSVAESTNKILGYIVNETTKN